MPKEPEERIKIQENQATVTLRGHPGDPPEGVNCPRGTGGEQGGLGVPVTNDRRRRGRTGVAGELREHNRTQSPPASISC